MSEATQNNRLGRVACPRDSVRLGLALETPTSGGKPFPDLLFCQQTSAYLSLIVHHRSQINNHASRI